MKFTCKEKRIRQQLQVPLFIMGEASGRSPALTAQPHPRVTHRTLKSTKKPYPGLKAEFSFSRETINHLMNIARRQNWTTVVIPCLLALIASACHAQDDPFGNSDDPFDSGSSAQPNTETPTVKNRGASEDLLSIARPNPVVDAIVSSNPTKPLEIINAIDSLLDIGRWDLAANYLKQLASLKLTDQQYYDLYKQAGSGKIFRLATQPDLDPDGKTIAKGILDGADRYATNSNRINELAKTAVTNEDRYQRSLALSDLRLLGDAGAAVLIEKLIDPAYKSVWPRIRQAIGLFGDAAAGPLSAALQSNSLKLRVEALYLMRNIDTSNAVESLTGAMLSDTSTDLQREVASQSIKRLLGRVPDTEESMQRLSQSTQQYLLDQVAISQDPNDMIKWWSWNDGDRKLVSSWLTAQTVARIRSFQRAEVLLSLDPDNRDYQILYWLARLETVKLSGGQNKPLLPKVLKSLQDSLDPQLALDVLHEAIRTERLNAAIASCEILGAMGDPTLLSADAGAMPSPLIEALSAGSVRLTSAAAEAIAKIDPSQSFPGSSDYLSALVYLSRSSGVRSAIVGNADLEIGQSLAAITSRQGFSARAATTSRSIFEQAQTDPDLNLIVITDKVFRPSFSELVQALRSNSRTQHIPILLMVEPENLARADRLAERYDGVLVSPMVMNDRVIARQIDNLFQGVRYQDANQAERGENALKALNQLDRYASQPERYPFYDLLSYQDDLLGGLASPSRAASTCRVLGEMGTPDAQRRLLQFASNLQLPLELRQVAADAFAVAVQKRGVMLSRQEIMAQYERYNASEEESAESRILLGTLLDVLESRSSD